MKMGNGKRGLVDKTRSIIVSAVLLVSIVSVQVWLSVFGYFTFYYVYMPVERYEQPVFLEYSSCKQFTGDERCRFPGSNITLRTDYSQNRVLMRGQKYDIIIDLELPQSPVNQKQGVFMVELSLYSENGEVTATTSKPVMLKYRSSLLRIFDTLVFAPFFLLGYRDESQYLSVPLMTNFVDHPNKPVVGAYIEVQARQVEIYSANFLIRAQFSGLRYLMYYWPIITAVFIICFNFVIMTIISYLSWNQISSFFFKEDAGVMEDDPLVELEDENDIVSFKISEREDKERAVRTKVNREDLLKELKSSTGATKPWSSIFSSKKQFDSDDSDDDILLCSDFTERRTKDSPTRVSDVTAKSGSSDSFETIDDRREEDVTMGTSEHDKSDDLGMQGARFRSKKASLEFT